MAYKNLVGASLAVVLLFICCGAFFFGFVASQDTDALSEDQQTSAQYYRPYNVNRRPAYPVRRPTYSNYINNQQRPVQRPVQRPQTPSVSSNYRPSAPTVAAQPSNVRPSTSNTGTGTSCTSSNIYRQYGICWDAQSQRLQIGPNLTIENLVRFHAYSLYSIPLISNERYSPPFWQQLCEQSRRFNRVGLMCSTKQGENYCKYYSEPDDSFSADSTALLCLGDDCICVVGEPYETIARQVEDQTLRNNPGNAPAYQSSYWQSWTAGLYQDIQNTLAASGIYWRP